MADDDLVKGIARLIHTYQWDSAKFQEESEELARRIIKRVMLHNANELRKMSEIYKVAEEE